MLCSFGQRGVSIHQVIEIYIYIRHFKWDSFM